MAFIRNKTVSGKRYNYLVETKRETGKVKSKTIVCLGKSISIDEELGKLTDQVMCYQRMILREEEEQAQFEKFAKEQYGWDRIRKTCRQAKRFNRMRTGLEGFGKFDPVALCFNAPGDGWRAFKDEMAWYHERTKKLASYRNTVGRLTGQIDHLRRIGAKYPTITVSAAIKKQHDDAARESAEALERLAGKIEGHLPPKSC